MIRDVLSPQLLRPKVCVEIELTLVDRPGFWNCGCQITAGGGEGAIATKDRSVGFWVGFKLRGIGAAGEVPFCAIPVYGVLCRTRHGFFQFEVPNWICRIDRNRILKNIWLFGHRDGWQHGERSGCCGQKTAYAVFHHQR